MDGLTKIHLETTKAQSLISIVTIKLHSLNTQKALEIPEWGKGPRVVLIRSNALTSTYTREDNAN